MLFLLSFFGGVCARELNILGQKKAIRSKLGNKDMGSSGGKETGVYSGKFGFGPTLNGFGSS